MANLIGYVLMPGGDIQEINGIIINPYDLLQYKQGRVIDPENIDWNDVVKWMVERETGGIFFTSLKSAEQARLAQDSMS